MKKMTKITLLLAMLAVGNSAQAQARYLKASQPYTFNGTTALGTGTMSYQWYRNGVEIPNATGESYTMPASLARGADVEIMRGVVSTACPLHISYTNRFVITFFSCMQVGNICWAEVNVNAYQIFAERPDMYTALYQWNRPTAWPATGDISGWSSVSNTSETWSINPCPTGWRLPTMTEFQGLHNTGTTWANANARGNAVAGSFYGPNHATPANCLLPNNMNDCIFLPAAGYRANSNGQLYNQTADIYAYYWSSMQYSSTNGYILRFNSTISEPSYNQTKSFGFHVRCVQNVN